MRCFIGIRQGGSKIFPLTKDHKPSEDLERKRIIEAGGQIYQCSLKYLIFYFNIGQQHQHQPELENQE
jgi:hypothetical protein